jgi:hypothetical protein
MDVGSYPGDRLLQAMNMEFYPWRAESKELDAVTTIGNANSPVAMNKTQVVDILSIGSKTRPTLQTAQRVTFGSHASVRHFIAVDEDDDADPQCATHLTTQQVYQISRYCRAQPRLDIITTGTVAKYMRHKFAGRRWLKKKKSSVGWLCAQRRPLHGLYKAFRQHYTSLGSNTNNNNSALCDLLVVLDDDTYWNMDVMHSMYQDDHHQSKLPLVRAGCLIREPIHQFNFTFPYGGFGLVLNKAALERLLVPINCRTENNDSSNSDDAICSRLSEDNIGERAFFHNGMNLIELMQAYAQNYPYHDFKNWASHKIKDGSEGGGYCLHSDW